MPQSLLSRILQFREFGPLCLAVCCLTTPALDAQRRAPGVENWVVTWATAQPIGAPSTMMRPPGRAAGPPPSSRSGPGGLRLGAPETLNDQTFRMTLRSTVGGRRLRLAFSNAVNAPVVKLGAAHIALHAKDSTIVEGSDRALTFDGKPGCTLGPGVLLYSDPIDFEVAPFAELAVSIYVPAETGPVTNHALGMHTAWISKGDAAGQTTMPEPALAGAYVWLTAVEIAAPPDAYTVVALGDSITDGQGTTMDANLQWSAVLAKRLAATKSTAHASVINMGVAGNQVLRDLAGVSALARFDRDVLARPGVRWLIVLEGINDISLHGQSDSADPLTSEDLVAAYRQMIARAHAFGIRVIGATITPQEGTRFGTPHADEVRNAVNHWVRTGGAFDAVVDLDASVRDPGHPSRLKPEFDSGDHIHINDAGNQAMASTFDLAIFR
jgi:lysophospholipase L1-like esterase